MWSNDDKNFPSRNFSTPPAAWRSPRSPAMLPMSERRVSPRCKRDLFHVIHKVPVGDSPYSRAKHVQLIEKDPGRAISLFWAAINSGDRVDSALKDMAVVMKQLNRTDEAIEAIKSFRHLCSYDSQESLDNVLIELFKRSGRIEEEIVMLQHKLKNLEEGTVFSGKRTKMARSQGRKIQITVDQERSRILGNLAWAYLQCHNYGLAEQHYRKALSMEPDKNKQCNLAICLMHMNRIPEAKSLLQAVRVSSGKQMDDSYAKSYERAFQMLNELDSQSALEPTGYDDQNCDRRNFYDGSSCLGTKTVGDSNWRKGSYLGSPSETSGFSSNLKENWISSTATEPRHKISFSSPAAVLYTQPRGSRKNVFAPPVPDPYTQPTSPLSSGEQLTENGLSHTIRNLSGELLDSNDEKSGGYVLQNSQSTLPSPAGNLKNNDKNNSTKFFNKSWADIVEEEEAGKEVKLCIDGCGCGGVSKDENQNCNIIHHSSCPKGQIENICQDLNAFDLRDSNGRLRKDASSSRNPIVRRSLCFDARKAGNIRGRNRLQVFRDITPSPDSP